MSYSKLISVIAMLSGIIYGMYFLMHDGRALSIEEAILMHGGEAEQSKNNFMQLTESEKKQLVKFLESL